MCPNTGMTMNKPSIESADAAGTALIEDSEPDGFSGSRLEAATLGQDVPTETHYALKLYVAGQSPKSLHAIANLKKICEENLQGHYELEVIDLYEKPQLAKGDEIIAVPTLVRKLPEPIRKIIGDLSDEEKVLVGLQLRPGR